MLCAPALAAMLLVTAYPLAHSVWLSLHRYDLRFPAERSFVGLANYASVLTADLWWQALSNTLVITIVSVTVELMLGLAIALLLHRSLVGRRTLRAAVLAPYAILTVVAALAWKFAVDPTVGFVDRLWALEQPWLGQRASALAVVIATEVWKTTPFMALMLLAGLTLVPQALLDAARLDGAGAWRRLWHITLPLMKPAIVVALLFRSLDAVRIFDTVYIQTRGAHATETVSLLGYQTLIARLNLGLGATVAVLTFLLAVLVAAVLLLTLGGRADTGRRLFR